MTHEKQFLFQGETKPKGSLKGPRDSVWGILNKASGDRTVSLATETVLDERNQYVDRYTVREVASQEEADEILRALEGRLVVDAKFSKERKDLRVDVPLDRYREGRLSMSAGARFFWALFVVALFLALAAAVGYDHWRTFQELL